MKKICLFILFLLFTSDIYSGGHQEKSYGPKPKIKLHGLHKAQCFKKGICDFNYKNEDVRQRAIELGFSSRSLKVRILNFEPHFLMRFSKKCYRQEDFVNRMWAVTADAIENAEHITVIGRKHRKEMIGTVYFGRKDSALTVMQKFRRSNDYCTS